MRRPLASLSFCLLSLSWACAAENNGDPADAGAGDADSDSDTDTDTGTDMGPRRVVAVGDHHGDFDQMLGALRAGGVIDEDGAWIGGTTILMQVGDILDRGDDEREIIDFYESLRGEAAALGGIVVNVNGNHEIMNAVGDYRYITAGGCHGFEDMEGLDTSNPAFDELPEYCKQRAAALWPGGPYAVKLAEWPMVTTVMGNLMVHGGVLPSHLEYGIDELNEETRAFLLGEGEIPWSVVGGGTSTDSSVDWDRTYSDDDEGPTEEDCQNLEDTLAELGADRMIVGHTVQGSINSACDGLVWRVDIGMAEYYGGSIQVLEISEGGEISILEDLAP